MVRIKPHCEVSKQFLSRLYEVGERYAIACIFVWLHHMSYNQGNVFKMPRKLNRKIIKLNSFVISILNENKAG